LELRVDEIADRVALPMQQSVDFPPIGYQSAHPE